MATPSGGELMTKEERLAAANERMDRASKRLKAANEELDAAEREEREAWEELARIDPKVDIV